MESQVVENEEKCQGEGYKEGLSRCRIKGLYVKV